MGVIRHEEELKTAMKKASPIGKWIDVIVVVAVIVLLYFFVGTPSKPYIK